MTAAEEAPLTATCACGWTFTGSEDDVVAATQDHAMRVHNMAASREDVLAQAQREPPASAD